VVFQTTNRANWVRGIRLATVFFACAAGIVARAQSGQSAEPNPNSAAPVAGLGGATGAVHGIVKNAATGEPLPRALVLIDGESGVGTLTDGDGRFEAAGITQGPNAFEIRKPGYEDDGGVAAGMSVRDVRGYTHNVFVTADTPELVFAMRPTNSIRGQIELSTGDVAQNQGVTLIRKSIQDGRAVWKPADSTRANADGVYRFAHLSDGDYVVVANGAPESELVGGLDQPQHASVVMQGYPTVYYPDARTFAGAAKIHLSGGQQAQANFRLPLEPYYPVEVELVRPAEIKVRGKVGYSSVSELVGSDGQQVTYPSDQTPDKVRALLPDGTYTVRVSANAAMEVRPGQTHAIGSHYAGQMQFTVAGHPLRNMQLPLGPATSTPIEVMITRTSQEAPQQPESQRGTLFVEVSQAGALTDGMSAMLAQGAGPGELETMPPSPGAYWVRTAVGEQGLCESSFTAGAGNLGREPLIVGLGGSTLPLTLSLRDDCASLQVSLPGAVAGMTAGEEPAYTVYAIPDFDITSEPRSITLRASSGGTFTFNSLTPGNYHVYTFAGPVELEYHNRDVLAGLTGQAVNLAPGAKANLVVEVPAR
jgi:hypothetical protein